MGSLKGSQTSTTSASPQATADYSQLLQQAQGVAATPYQAYTGELTAPINSQQQQGVGGINAAAGQAQPAINTALGIAGGAANPLTDAQIQEYQNPYTQDVVNATQEQFNNQNAQQQTALTGNIISQGALGGNRAGVAQANLAGQQSVAEAPTIAGLYANSYNSGLATAGQQFQQNPLAAAGSIANFGVSGENAALSGAGAELGAGTVEQQTAQAADTANYNQYAQAQAYPFQTEQWLAGLEGAIAPGLGSSTTGPAPNTTAQYLGAGVAGAGLALSDRRAKKNIHKIGSLNDGQPIYRYQYIGSDEWHVGPMAQEVEKHHPHAVHEGVGGAKYVDLKAATEDSVHRASGGVVSDADPESVSAGQQYAQSSPYQIRPNQDGTHSVINVRTGQIHFTGTPSGAQNAQSSLNYRNRASGGGVGGTPWSTAQGWVPTFSGTNAAPHSVSPPSTPASPNINWSQLGNTKANPNGPFANSPTYGGGNMLTDAGGGSSSDPLPGLDASDYGAGFMSGGGVGRARFADGGSPSFDDRFVGGDDPSFDDRFAPASDSPFQPMGPSQGIATRSMGPPAPDIYDDGQGPVRMYGDRPAGDETALKGTGIAANPSGKPVVASSDDDEDEVPTPGKGVVGPSGGVAQPPGTYSADVDQAPYKALAEPGKGLGIGFGLISPNAQSGLLAAGLGMLASRSPFLGNAIGEGGAAGLTAFNAGEEHDRKIAAEAQKLSQEAKKEADELALRRQTQAETSRHNRATEANASDKSPMGYQKNRDGTLAFIPGGPHDPTQIAAETNARAKKGDVLDDDTVDAIAQRVAQGDTRAVIGLGRNPAAIAQIQKRTAEIFKEQGLDHEAGAKAILGNIADQAGRMTAERTQAGIASKLAVYGRNVDNAIGVAAKASEEANRTEFTPVNVALNAYHRKTGDPKIVALGQALNTLTNEYARAIGGGHGTVHDKEQAEHQLNEAQSHQQLLAIMGVMHQEIEMTKKSMPEARQEMHDLYSRPSSESQRQGPAAAAPAGSAAGTVVPPAATQGTVPAGAVGKLKDTSGRYWYVDKDNKPLGPVQ